MINSMLAKGSDALKTMLEIVKEHSRLAVPMFFQKMKAEHGRTTE